MSDTRQEHESTIEKLHRRACMERRVTYLDPFTELEVFTRDYLLHRGYCCNQDCRHCPYDGMNISIRFKGI